MASVTPTTSSTKEKANYSRLCYLLVHVGICVLRDIFDSIYTPPTLRTVLATNQSLLKSLRTRRIINATQWGKLFPAIPTSVSSRDFDISLLIILLRNICGLAPPATGWDALPAATDMSREADIARVRHFRNTVYALAEYASVDDATFHEHWKEIRDTLVRLGAVDYKVAIDKLEVVCMDQELEDHYKDLLIQWKSDEDYIKDGLKEIDKKTDVSVVASAVTSVSKETSNEDKSFKLEEMSNTSFVCGETNHENELQKFFCKQCKVCICDKCGQARHNNHTKVDIHQAAEQHKVDIEEIVKEMENEIAGYKKHVEKTNEFCRKSKEKIATARNEVMTSVEELIQLLKEYESATLTKLEVIEKKEERGHVAQLEHFNCSIKQLQTSVKCCEAILERNQSVEILKKHHSLIEQCRGLLNSEKPDIYKPLHVRYEINKDVENVRSAFPAVGRVLVSSTDPLQSVAEGSGLEEPDVGNEATIKITTNDSHKNKCYEEDDQIHVKVQTPSGVELSYLLTASEDGDHLITFTPDCVGQHDVMIAVNGQPLTDSPWRVRVAPHRYESVFSFGSYGKGQTGRFDRPWDIAISDKTMNIAVADRWNNRVQLFNPDGTYLKDISALTKATSVAFTRSSEVIVVASNKIFCFNESGDFLKRVTNKHLKAPYRLTIARDGRMVVCDNGDNTVKVLSSDGAQLLHTISAPGLVFRVLSYAVCHQNMFFVSYPLAHSVKVFGEDGVFLYSIGTPGSGDGQLNFPVGLTVDRFNNLVVCDSNNKRLQVFTLEGKFVSKIEGQHIGFENPFSVAVSSTGHLFVTDKENHRVHVFK